MAVTFKAATLTLRHVQKILASLLAHPSNWLLFFQYFLDTCTPTRKLGASHKKTIKKGQKDIRLSAPCMRNLKRLFLLPQPRPGQPHKPGPEEQHRCGFGHRISQSDISFNPEFGFGRMTLSKEEIQIIIIAKS